MALLLSQIGAPPAVQYAFLGVRRTSTAWLDSALNSKLVQPVWIQVQAPPAAVVHTPTILFRYGHPSRAAIEHLVTPHYGRLLPFARTTPIQFRSGQIFRIDLDWTVRSQYGRLVPVPPLPTTQPILFRYGVPATLLPDATVSSRYGLVVPPPGLVFIPPLRQSEWVATPLPDPTRTIGRYYFLPVVHGGTVHYIMVRGNHPSGYDDYEESWFS